MITRESSMSHRKAALPLLLAVCLMAGLWMLYPKQTPQKWQLTDVTGHLPDLHFSLTADDGQTVSGQNYRGDISLLYFGYTGCPGQCPATLARLSHLLHEWHEATPLHILFVSITPAIDTPRVLHHYISSFDDRSMTGLTGEPDAIAALARRCRAAYRPNLSGGEIAHSAITYVFDPRGRARLLITPGDSDKNTLSDLQRLAHEFR